MIPNAVTSAAATSGATSSSGAQAIETDAQKDGLAAGAIASDFETFLNLLTAQLKNQDPLKPLESTEFVAQLAQFSAVEQQVRSNETLGRIEAALVGGAGLTEWLGVEVETASALSFSGDPVALRYEADPTAASATLQVRNQSGGLVAQQALDTGAASITWNGQSSGGQQAPVGFYTFSVEQTDSSGEVRILPASGFALVTESRLAADKSIELVLEGGDVTSASLVTAARNS